MKCVLNKRIWKSGNLGKEINNYQEFSTVKDAKEFCINNNFKIRCNGLYKKNIGQYSIYLRVDKK